MSAVARDVRRESEAEAPDGGARSSELAEDVHWFGGSRLGILFRFAMIEQVAHPVVAAAIDNSGRFAANFTDRGIRSFAQTLLMEWGDPFDKAAEVDKVKRLHRSVTGHGRGEFADVRYSALMPEVWGWITLSGALNYYHSYIAGPGRHLDLDAREEVYREIYRHQKALDLGGSAGKLPDNLTDALAAYDEIVTTKLESNEIFRLTLENFSQPPMPEIGLSPRMRRLLAPAWPLLAKCASRPQTICSLGISHPGVRELLGADWRPRHQLEFEIYCGLVRMVWAHGPRRATLLKIAFNRWEYDKIRKAYSSVVLDTYAPLAEVEESASDGTAR